MKFRSVAMQWDVLHLLVQFKSINMASEWFSDYILFLYSFQIALFVSYLRNQAPEASYAHKSTTWQKWRLGQKVILKRSGYKKVKWKTSGLLFWRYAYINIQNSVFLVYSMILSSKMLSSYTIGMQRNLKCRLILKKNPLYIRQFPYFLQINWKETWLIILMAIHFLCFIIILLTRKRTNVQLFIFVGLSKS